MRKMEQKSENGDKKSFSFMFAKVATENVTKSDITFDFLDNFMALEALSNSI